MDFFRSVKFKTNIDFFYDCAEYISEDSTFNIDDSVYMCWTDDNKKFIPIHNFIDKLKNKLKSKMFTKSTFAIALNNKTGIAKFWENFIRPSMVSIENNLAQTVQ